MRDLGSFHVDSGDREGAGQPQRHHDQRDVGLQLFHAHAHHGQLVGRLAGHDGVGGVEGQPLHDAREQQLQERAPEVERDASADAGQLAAGDGGDGESFGCYLPMKPMVVGLDRVKSTLLKPLI